MYQWDNFYRSRNKENDMKKYLICLLAMLMALSLVSCGAGEKETDGDVPPPEADGSGAPADDA